MRRFVALVALAFAATGAVSQASATSAAASKTLKVVLVGQSHHPKLHHVWSYSVTVTDAATGKPVAVRIDMQFWFAGSKVGEVGVHNVKNGIWKETFKKESFPAVSVGQPLVLRAFVTAPGYAKGVANWKVAVVK